MIHDPIREHLRQRGCPDVVVNGGLAWLVNAWEKTVESVIQGEQQFQDEYENDMDTRQIIQEVLPLVDSWHQLRIVVTS